MKRTAQVCFLLFLCLLMTVSVSAAGTTTYELDELDMSIEIPSEYIIFTRDISPDDPKLSMYGYTKQDVLSSLEFDNAFLDGWDEDLSFEIIVTMEDSTLEDFSGASNIFLNTYAAELEDFFESNGITFINSKIYQQGQMKFIKIYTRELYYDYTVYKLQYYTVYANKAISIAIKSYFGEINTEQEEIVWKMVNSARFGTERVKQTTSTVASLFTYTDEETGISFTVPANWSQKELSKERETLDVKFVSDKDVGFSILYGSTDILGALPASERAGFTREDIDTMLTKEDIAEMLGVAGGQLNTVSYGGKQYYKTEVSNSSVKFGMEIKTHLTVLFKIENGYMITFQYGGPSDVNDAEFYRDFEKLLDSVQYPESFSEPDIGAPVVERRQEPIPTENKQEPVARGQQESILNNLLVSLLLTITVYALPIIIYRYGIRKRPVGAKIAKWITILYGIFAYLIMGILLFVQTGTTATASVALLWGFVNYNMLTKGEGQASASKTEVEYEPMASMAASGEHTDSSTDTEQP